jgi:hypothetical protein
MIPWGWMVPLAIATGNTVVLKAASYTPLTSMRIMELFYEEGGFPAGVVNLVTCSRNESELFLTDPRVKAVTFVGSTDIGKHIYSVAAAHGKRVQAQCEAKNHALVLEDCDLDMQREHYEDSGGRFISELFESDRAALLPLPAVPFDTALYTSATTNKYGKFSLDKGKHIYSASPSFSESVVQLKITSSEVVVMDSDLHEIVRHRRLYGDERESMDWIPYLRHIARRPRSLRNSGIYGMMPEVMQEYMDRCESSERGKVLKVLAELTERSGFDSALNTVSEAVRLHATDPDSLQSLYRRIYTDVPLLPPLEAAEGIPPLKVIRFPDDLTGLDAILKGGAANG